MSDNDKIFTALSDTLTRLSELLLQIPVLTADQLIDTLIEQSDDRSRLSNADGDGYLRRIDDPKVLIHSTVMGDSTSYVIELITVGEAVGFTVITNKDHQPDVMNRFLEIVPTYVRRADRMFWFYQELTPRMLYRVTRIMTELADQMNDFVQGPDSSQLAKYRSLVMRQHNLSEEVMDVLLQPFEDDSLAVAYLKTVMNVNLGATTQRRSAFEDDELPHTRVDMIAGASPAGKTHYALSLATRAAATSGESILVFSPYRLDEITQDVLGKLDVDYGNMSIQQTRQTPRDLMDNEEAMGLTDDIIVVFDLNEDVGDDIREFIRRYHSYIDHVIIVVNWYHVDQLRPIEDIPWPKGFEHNRFIATRYLAQRSPDPDHPFVVREIPYRY